MTALFLVAVDTLRGEATFAASGPALALAVGSAPDAELSLPASPPAAAEFRREDGSWRVRLPGSTAAAVRDGWAFQAGPWTVFAFLADERRASGAAARAAERLGRGSVAPLEPYFDAGEAGPLPLRGPAPALLGSARCCRLRVPGARPPVVAIVRRAGGARTWLYPVPGAQVLRNDALVVERTPLRHGDRVRAPGGVELRYCDPGAEVDLLLGAVEEPDAAEPAPRRPPARERVAAAIGGDAAPVSYAEAALVAAALAAAAAFAAVFIACY